MIILESHTVPELTEPQRLSEYAVGIFRSKPSRNGVKKAIKKGLVFINNKKGNTGDFIKGQEKIDLYQESTESRKIKPDTHIEIVYQDPFLAIINKPAGIVVSGNKARTLSHFVAYIIDPSPENDALPFPLPVHRLDYPTSGLIIYARTIKALHGLHQLFRNRKIKKTYIAITIGHPGNKKNIDSMVNGKESLSHFQLLSSAKSGKFGQLNLCKLSPVTGRRHQLRIHMADSGTPILGDSKYGKEGFILKGKGLYLMALRIEFVHPVSDGKIDVSIPLATKFMKIFPGYGDKHIAGD